MQVTEHYPSLLIVFSTHDTTWYHVPDGATLRQLEYMHTDDPDYSDREGHFQTSGKGKTMGQGQPDTTNAVHHETLRDHLTSAIERTEDLLDNDDYQHIVVTMPAHHKGMVQKELTDVFKKDDEYISVYGNFVNVDDSVLLDRFHEALKPDNN